MEMETVFSILDLSRVLADEMVAGERRKPLPLYPYLGPSILYRARKFMNCLGQVFGNRGHGFAVKPERSGV